MNKPDFYFATMSIPKEEMDKITIILNDIHSRLYAEYNIMLNSVYVNSFSKIELIFSTNWPYRKYKLKYTISMSELNNPKILKELIYSIVRGFTEEANITFCKLPLINLKQSNKKLLLL